MKMEISSVNNWKEASEKRLCVMLIHFTELELSLKKPFTKTVLVEFAK